MCLIGTCQKDYNDNPSPSPSEPLQREQHSAEHYTTIKRQGPYSQEANRFNWGDKAREQ